MKKFFYKNLYLILALFVFIGCQNIENKDNKNVINKDNKNVINKDNKNVINKDNKNVSNIESIKFSIENKIFEINISENISKSLNKEIENLLKSGKDKQYESIYENSLEFGQHKILFNEFEIKDREKNNKEIKKTMEDDIQTHIEGGFSEEQIEKKFGKVGSKIRTTATCAINIDGKDFSIYNDENLINLIFDIYSKINK